jgi:hypothetical protein
VPVIRFASTEQGGDTRIVVEVYVGHIANVATKSTFRIFAARNHPINERIHIPVSRTLFQLLACLDPGDWTNSGAVDLTVATAS